ncbi:MAG: DUF6519 domain-containing protein [Candidatus Competibacteraceae bacterium]
MKTQLSRTTHDKDKRYSGVYQQQGRMLTDADWNELVDVLKQQLRDALAEAVGDGAPRDGGLAVTQVDNEVRIVPGSVYIAGLRAVLPGDHTKPLKLTEQPDFPGAPALDLQAHPNALLYADVWERVVVSLEDENLRDPGLHGADTCTRLQTMVQVKWCEPLGQTNPVYDPRRNPSCGTAVMKPRAWSSNASAERADPCLTPEARRTRLGNYLFRVEAHAVELLDAGKQIKLTLKWSSENGAEQYALWWRDSEGQQHAGWAVLPQGFLAADWTYELYNDLSEKHLGQHLTPPGFTPVKGLLWSKTEIDGAKSWPKLEGDQDVRYIRRWDGFCTLTLTRTAANAPWQPSRTEVVEGSNDRGVALAIRSSDQPQTHGAVIVEGNDLSFALAGLILNLTLDDHVFVPGDYWLAVVREDALYHEAATGRIDERVQTLNNGRPLGIVHHYLLLGEVSNGTLIAPVNGSETQRQRSFPPLTNLTADRVGYDPAVQLVRWQDVNDVAETTRQKPVTVQQALDDLIGNLDSSDIKYTLPTCAVTNSLLSLLKSQITTFTEGSEAKTKLKDLWDALLCYLDAAKIPYNYNLKAERWKDINEVSNLTGPATVQSAIDDLISNLDSSDIPHTVPTCTTTTYGAATLLSLLQSHITTFSEGGKTKAKLETLWNTLLCSLDAAGIPYNWTLQADRWKDIKELGSDAVLTGPATLQQAIDDLISNLDSSDIPHTVPTCAITTYGAATLLSLLQSHITTFSEGGKTKAKLETLWNAMLCSLDAAGIPYNWTLQADRWKDIKEVSALTGPATVQSAIDDLISNLDSSDIPHTVPTCATTAYGAATLLSLLQSHITTFSEGGKTKTKLENLWNALLCYLDAAGIPYDCTQEDAWQNKLGASPATLQQAIDELLLHFDSGYIGYAVPACSSERDSVRSRLNLNAGDAIRVAQVLDALLCELDAAAIPYAARDTSKPSGSVQDLMVKKIGDTMTGPLTIDPLSSVSPTLDVRGPLKLKADEGTTDGSVLTYNKNTGLANWRETSLTAWNLSGGNLSTDTNSVTGSVTLGSPEKESLHITADGKVGIGTQAPATALHIVTKTSESDYPDYGLPWLEGQHIADAATKMWGLKDVYGRVFTWDSDSLFIGLKNEGSDRKDAVIAWGNNPPDSLRFLFIPSFAAYPPKEVVRLTADGRLGIGVTDPQAQLVIGDKFGAAVSGSSAGGAVFGANLATRDNTNLFTPYEHTTNGYAGIQARGGQLSFFTAADSTTAGNPVTPPPRLSINAQGEVSIGTDATPGSLKVTGNTTVAGTLAVYGPVGKGTSGTTGKEPGLYIIDDNGNGDTSGNEPRLYIIGDSVSKPEPNLYIGEDGHVGIGTTKTARARLVVDGDVYVTGRIIGRRAMQFPVKEIQDVEVIRGTHTPTMGSLTASLFYLTEPQDVILFVGVFSLQFINGSSNRYLKVKVALRHENDQPIPLIDKQFDYSSSSSSDIGMIEVSLAAGLNVINVDCETNLDFSEQIRIKTLSLLIVEKGTGLGLESEGEGGVESFITPSVI